MKWPHAPGRKLACILPAIWQTECGHRPGGIPVSNKMSLRIQTETRFPNGHVCLDSPRDKLPPNCFTRASQTVRHVVRESLRFSSRLLLPVGLLRLPRFAFVKAYLVFLCALSCALVSVARGGPTAPTPIGPGGPSGGSVYISTSTDEFTFSLGDTSAPNADLQIYENAGAKLVYDSGVVRFTTLGTNSIPAPASVFTSGENYYWTAFSTNSQNQTSSNSPLYFFTVYLVPAQPSLNSPGSLYAGTEVSIGDNLQFSVNLPSSPVTWIRKMAMEHKMIDPFIEHQVRDGVISYGVSSYGYDVRVANEFKIFTNVFSTTVDPKQFDPKSMVDFVGEVCVIPPNSFALARTVGIFPHPAQCVDVVHRRKSTYARCGIIVNVTLFEPEWEGFVTLEILKSIPLPARIYANEGLAQVLFFEASRICWAWAVTRSTRRSRTSSRPSNSCSTSWPCRARLPTWGSPRKNSSGPSPIWPRSPLTILPGNPTLACRSSAN